jgi:heme-degrading monooxygenase HmoA
MLVRMFQFRAKKGTAAAVKAFMRKKPLRLLKRVRGCLRAYFTRSEGKGEYVWVTVWTSERAIKRAMGRPDWKGLVAEETRRFFAGKPKVRHFEVLVRK